MKKLFSVLVVAFLTFNVAQAQRVVFVDMDKILGSITEYESAQRELEGQAEKWRQEIARKYENIEKMYRDYQAREPLMSDEARKEAQDKIIQKEQDARDLQKKYFGPEGELFQKRQSLVKPIQEKVYTVIEKYAKDRSFDFIFTAPDGSSIIYANPDKDVTNDIIKRLEREK
ncbi:MAG: OmpH family outer membrane protein [Saprospiraceae bacterium]|nr:OmpH family outer membrane protein [Saprospiraceae bacterium]